MKWCIEDKRAWQQSEGCCLAPLSEAPTYPLNQRCARGAKKVMVRIESQEAKYTPKPQEAEGEVPQVGLPARGRLARDAVQEDSQDYG